MKRAYIKSTTKEGITCQTEVTWGQWLANRVVSIWNRICCFSFRTGGLH